MARCGEKRLGLSLALGLVAVLAAGAPARAETNCAYSAAAKLLLVTVDDLDDVGTLSVSPSGEILVTGNPAHPCTGAGGPPTVTNTDAIEAVVSSSTAVLSIVGAGQFAPGASVGPAENGGTPEIEITVDVSGGGVVSVTQSPGDPVRIGEAGVNPNASPNEVAPDADIFTAGGQPAGILGTDGDDVISAQGGLGTGDPIDRVIGINARDGNDLIVGGDGQDSVIAGAGNDQILGMSGPDLIRPGPPFGPFSSDDDAVDGGAGNDSVAYSNDFAGVTVDLALSGPQDTAGGGTDSLSSVESVSGTVFADVILGNGDANDLRGLGGNDILVGEASNDALAGDEGDDVLNVRDGGLDTATCGSGNDTVWADVYEDLIAECETQIFPEQDVIPPALATTPPAVDNAACDAAKDELKRANAKLKKLKRKDARASKIKKAKAKVKKAKQTVEVAC